MTPEGLQGRARTHQALQCGHVCCMYLVPLWLPRANVARGSGSPPLGARRVGPLDTSRYGAAGSQLV